MLVSTSCRGGRPCLPARTGQQSRRPLRDKIGMAEQLEYDTDE